MRNTEEFELNLVEKATKRRNEVIKLKKDQIYLKVKKVFSNKTPIKISDVIEAADDSKRVEMQTISLDFKNINFEKRNEDDTENQADDLNSVISIGSPASREGIYDLYAQSIPSSPTKLSVLRN